MKSSMENILLFKHKDKERFTRSKVIGIDYTEDRLKERIKENANNRTYPIKKRIGNIIDIDNNEKIKNQAKDMNIGLLSIIFK